MNKQSIGPAYPEANPSDGLSKRLTLDVPTVVHTRIKASAPRRNLWRVLLSNAVAQLDRQIKAGRVRDLSYPLCEEVVYEIISELTKQNVDVDKIIEEVYRRNKPQPRPTPDGERIESTAQAS